jgi:methionyl-tRNA synthetase
MSRFYITTPIYYLNDQPHIGHAYTTVAADTAARWRRLCGEEVLFLTGTDEHGQKVMQAAQARGLSAQEHCDQLSAAFRTLWGRLLVQHDDFIRTTEPRHMKVVQAALQGLYEKGEIYPADYSGWYSVAAERFWTEEELVDGKCPDSGRPVEWVTERNYFFRMSAWQERLMAHIAANPDCIQPEWRKNEVLGFLQKPINDLCISRPRARIPWGIPLPFDADYITYVWFDALTNYASAIGLHSDPARFEKWWPEAHHLCGKDILTFHTVYWFTMLLAQGIAPPKQVYAHGWWLVEGQKMSKSVGNVVSPNLLVDAYGPDAVRYFLLREVAFGADGEFAHASFLARYNADLANDLGNLAHRTLTMTEKWLGGQIAPAGPQEGGDEALWALAEKCTRTFDQQLRKLQFRDALEALFELVGAGNKYLDREGPWTLNKEGKVERLGTVLRNTAEICRIAASHLACVCPAKATELLQKLGESAPTLSPRLDVLPAGRPIQSGEPLFPRLMDLPDSIKASLEAAGLSTAAATPSARIQRTEKAAPKEVKVKKETPVSTETPAAPVAPAAPASTDITYEDFAKLQLRTGKVVEAANHPNADRLLVLKVDIGEAEPRTIVAGIAAVYKPEQLLGQQVVVVANLKPAKLRGVMSQGMLLAAGGADVAALVRPQQELPPGTVVK